MKTFLHSGGCGDIIYALPFIKSQGGGILYVKKSNVWNTVCNQFESLKLLLEEQDYIQEVREYPTLSFFEYKDGIQIDYDLDLFRRQQVDFLNINFMKLYFQTFKISEIEIEFPFLAVDKIQSPSSMPYALINVTPRYRDSQFDWKKIMPQMVEQYGTNIFFIGLPSEYSEFIKNTDSSVIYLETKNLLEAAQYISQAAALYCNQSVCLSIAQALGAKYYLEVSPVQTSGIIKTPNENFLNK